MAFIVYHGFENYFPLTLLLALFVYFWVFVPFSI